MPRRRGRGCVLCDRVGVDTNARQRDAELALHLATDLRWKRLAGPALLQAASTAGSLASAAPLRTARRYSVTAWRSAACHRAVPLGVGSPGVSIGSDSSQSFALQAMERSLWAAAARSSRRNGWSRPNRCKTAGAPARDSRRSQVVRVSRQPAFAAREPPASASKWPRARRARERRASRGSSCAGRPPRVPVDPTALQGRRVLAPAFARRVRRGGRPAGVSRLRHEASGDRVPRPTGHRPYATSPACTGCVRCRWGPQGRSLACASRMPSRRPNGRTDLRSSLLESSLVRPKLCCHVSVKVAASRVFLYASSASHDQRRSVCMRQCAQHRAVNEFDATSMAACSGFALEARGLCVAQHQTLDESDAANRTTLLWSKTVETGHRTVTIPANA